MTDREQDLTPALAEAQRKRERLHETLVRAEAAISAPAPGRLPAWTSEATRSLTNLRVAFEGHVAATEAAGGLYEEILSAAPRLAGKVRRLGEEHPTIMAGISGQIDRLSSPVAEDTVDDVRDDIQRVLGQVVRHRQHGADLVWEAYSLDIGGIE